MTTPCYRCGKPVPEPDIKESIAREMDWRDWQDDHPLETLDNEPRVLICMPCADELEDLENE